MSDAKEVAASEVDSLVDLAMAGNAASAGWCIVEAMRGKTGTAAEAGYVILGWVALTVLGVKRRHLGNIVERPA